MSVFFVAACALAMAIALFRENRKSEFSVFAKLVSILGATSVYAWILWSLVDSGGWWWLLAVPLGCAPWTLVQEKLAPVDVAHQQPPEPVPTTPPFIPSPEQLAQIEDARSRSLTVLKERTEKKQADEKQAKKAARLSCAQPTIDPISLPEKIKFAYKGSDGKMSNRVVLVKKIYPQDDNPKFYGWCEGSGALKSFRIDRVQGDVTRFETGEIVPPWLWLGAVI